MNIPFSVPSLVVTRKNQMIPNIHRLVMFVGSVILAAASSLGVAHDTCQYLSSGLGHGCVELDQDSLHRHLIACDDDWEDGWEIMAMARTADGMVNVIDEQDIEQPGCWEYRLGEADPEIDSYAVCASRPNEEGQCTPWESP